MTVVFAPLHLRSKCGQRYVQLPKSICLAVIDACFAAMGCACLSTEEHAQVTGAAIHSMSLINTVNDRYKHRAAPDAGFGRALA